MSIRFNDNVEFNTEGRLRIERRSDGYYVVGNGILIPVDNQNEGLELIKELSNNSR